MTKNNLRVFVSSTFEDLAEYRNAVRDAVLRAGAMPILFEEQPASARPVAETVRQAIDRSDAVLLLVGHRYGAGDPQTGKGWIEAEYEAARKRAKPLLVFMAADDAPWPPKFIDPDRTKIQAFRQRLASDLVVHTFRGPDDLRFAVIEALAQFVSARERPPEVATAKTPKTREIRIVKLLLSSPGDVADERDRVARAVFRFNQQAVEERGLFIKLVRWEDMAPQIGPKAQAVINKQIGDYHLFAGSCGTGSARLRRSRPRAQRKSLMGRSNPGKTTVGPGSHSTSAIGQRTSRPLSNWNRSASCSSFARNSTTKASYGPSRPHRSLKTCSTTI